MGTDKAKYCGIFKAFLVLLFTVTVFLAGCGGGGGGDDDLSVVTPPTQDVRGTYELRGFLVIYSDGEVYADEDVSSFSGSMQIRDDTLSQSLTLNGQEYSFMSGTYSITYTNGTSEGLLYVSNSPEDYVASFSTAGTMFHTYSGVVPYDDELTFEEWHYWEKISDDPGMVSGCVEAEKEVPSQLKFIGDIIMDSQKK